MSNLGKTPSIHRSEAVNATVRNFTPATAPTAAAWGTGNTISVGGFIWIADGTTNTPFPAGWSRNGNTTEVPIETRTLTFGYQADLSDAATLQDATITRDCFISFSGNVSEVFEVIFIVNGARLPVIEAQPFQFAFTLDDYPASTTEFSVTARIEFEDGSKERIFASFSVERVVNNPVFITADRDTTVTMTGQTGGTAPDLVFNLGNTSPDLTPTYSATDDASWITPTIVGDVLTLAFPVSGLAAGVYQGTVTVTSPGLVPLVITVNLTVTAAATYQLVHADNSGFTNPSSLASAVLSNARYIGILPTTGVSQVLWNLDGRDAVTRTGTPFDFGADAAATSAASYDTSVLANGNHTLTATITPTGGQRNYILQSQTVSTAPWSVFTVTVTTGDTIAGPEGSTLMYAAQTVGASVLQHTLSQLISKPSATALQFSARVFIKPKAGSEHYYFRMIVGDTSSLTGYCSFYFRLDPGNVGSVSTGVINSAAGWSIISATVVESSVTGIYEVKMVGTTDVASTLYARITWNSTAGGSSTYAAGTATGAYLAWQVDFGTAAMTTYTPTTTTQVIGTGGTPTTISATFATQNAAKILEVDKPSIAFIGTVGAASPTAQTLTLKPTVGTAAWTSAEVVDMPWLTVTASGSASPGTPSTVTLTPTTGALAVGQYTGTVRFSATGYASVDVQIQFNVGAAAPTYDLYYSPTAVGAADAALLQGATATRFFLWLANTTTPRTPVAIATNTTDVFRFWNTATTITEEATKAATLTRNAGSTAVVSAPTGLVENAAGPKNYHWTLTVGGVTSRGDVSYNYGTTSAHKNVRGLALRVDRYEGKGPGQTDGQHFLSASELAYLQSPDVVCMNVMFGWNKIERVAGSGTTSGTFTWTQVDHMVSVAASMGKLINICISPKKWAGAPPPDLAAQANLWNTGTGSDFTGLANWNNSTMRARYKNILRAFSQRYDSNPTVLGLWTDETSQGVNAAYDSLSGSNQVSRSIGWYQLLYELITETPQLFKNTHLFIGAATFNAAQMPGGNFDLLANAGVSIAWPDSLYSSATIDRGQRLMYQYKGRVTGMVWGDSYQAAANEGYPNVDRISLIMRMNVDWQYPTPTLPTAYGPPTSEAGCTRTQIMGFMPFPTSVRTPPAQARWQSDVSNMLAYIRNNPQHFAGVAPVASNLANKV